MAWARELGAERVWALEDCRNLAGALERLLLAAGERVLRVLPKLMASERKQVRSFGNALLLVAGRAIVAGDLSRRAPRTSLCADTGLATVCVIAITAPSKSVPATALCDSRVVGARVSPRFRDWAGALGQVAHSGPLRHAQISFAAMWAGESAFMVALGVVAFRDGGVAAVGAVTAARMAPAALLAPFFATMGDRVRRERVLACVGAIRAATLGCAAVVTAAGGPAAATYGFAVVATVAMTLYRPAHSALLPALAKSPQELTSANAVRGMLDSSAKGGP